MEMENGIGNNNSTRDNNVGNGIGNTVEVDDRFEIGNKSGQMKTIAEKTRKNHGIFPFSEEQLNETSCWHI